MRVVCAVFVSGPSRLVEFFLSLSKSLRCEGFGARSGSSLLDDWLLHLLHCLACFVKQLRSVVVGGNFMAQLRGSSNEWPSRIALMSSTTS